MIKNVVSTERKEEMTNILHHQSGRVLGLVVSPKFILTLECGHVAERKSPRTVCECTECR